jgi:biopolymer transport protein ExbD
VGGAELGSSGAKSEPNVVPLCDILLVLLIIFMVLTPMLKKGAHVTLPKAANTADQPSQNALTIYLKKDGVVNFEGVNFEDLGKLSGAILEKLETDKKAGGKILIKADQDVEYGRVVDVMSEIRMTNLEEVSLVTEIATSSD